MDEPWKYQIRIDLDDAAAEAARGEGDHASIKPLEDTLARHHAVLKCQFHAFADYVAEAEAQGVANYPLYAWTKATIENPDKRAKYLKSFTLYVEGEEVYARHLADALEADLQPLVERGLIKRLAKYDSNPANNPQPPAQYRG
ncbi:hypothetical protein [Bradyrhizobium sp. STM 3557]|uniref:hypothetical protein n=1 Tax=Bradyrhizobium sp. STM 3557 TaxID=578920 RepID=UPI003890EDA1